MSEKELDNVEAFFPIVHNNPRRRGVIREAGILVSRDAACRFLAWEASQKRRPKADWQAAAALVIAVIAVIGMTVAAIG